MQFGEFLLSKKLCWESGRESSEAVAVDQRGLCIGVLRWCIHMCVCVFALSATALAAEIVVFLFISSYSFLQVLLGCAVRLRIGLPLCPWEGGGVNWTPFCFCDQSTVFIQGEAV